jgi:hypothetical protein
VCSTADQLAGSAAEALRMAGAGLDFLNSPAAGDLQAAAVGEVLTSLSELQSKLAAARAAFLRQFDAADGHDDDGYATSSAWLAAKAKMSRKGARAAVWQMRLLRARPQLAAALAAAVISESWAAEIIRWTKDLPAELRAATDQVLVDAAVAGASLDDLAAIAAYAVQQWRSQHPDPDEDDGFDDRYVAVGTTFGGAGIIRGNLTPECAAAVQAVLDALGKNQGREDHRSEGQRWHDALQLGCELLLRAKLVPGRAGADTQVIAHIPLSWLRQRDGGSAIEQAWINAGLGEPGYLAGKDAEVVACDARTVPAVTGHADMTVIDQIIELALTACHDHPERAKPRPLSPQAWAALRYAIARLAVDFLSGPNGLARGAAHRAAAGPVQHPQPAAGHRLLRQHSGAYPPRRHPQGQALRLAPLRPRRLLLRRAPHRAQGRRRQDQRQLMCSIVPVSP